MTSTLTAIADAHANAGSPTYKNPQSPALGVDSSPLIFSYIDFGQPVPVGSSWTVVDAKLRLYQKGAATGGARTLTARLITASWQESTLDWNHKPAASATGYNSASQGDSATEGRLWEIDVTAAMQAVSDGQAFYGFRVESNNATAMLLHSSESTTAAFRPQLVITVAPDPEPPHILNPSAGRAVSVARPVVNFDYVDPDGDAMQAYQLQANMTTDDFSSPDYDSGTVASEIKQHTWTFDINAAEVWYWRVRVQDVAGNWSDWSQSTSFTRTAKPTVSWVDPAAGTFTNPNLPTDVSLSVGTQTARQLFVADDTLTTVLYDSKKFSTSVTAFEVGGQNFLPTPGETYGLVRRTWDSVTRASTPNDPVYVDISKTVTFATSGASPVSALTAGPEGIGLPGIDLEWTDATATADQYLIVRDGGAAALVDFADTLVSGTSHLWTDEVAFSRQGHDYEVYAVTAGVTSNASATVHGDNLPEGVWVRIPNSSTAVQLTGELTVEANEASAVYSPLGAENQVLITQAQWGRKGRLEGGNLGDGSQDLPALKILEARWETIRRHCKAGGYVVVTQVNKSFVADIYNTWTGFVDESIAANAGSFIPVGFDYIERR